MFQHDPIRPLHLAIVDWYQGRHLNLDLIIRVFTCVASKREPYFTFSPYNKNSKGRHPRVGASAQGCYKDPGTLYLMAPQTFSWDSHNLGYKWLLQFHVSHAYYYREKLLMGLKAEKVKDSMDSNYDSLFYFYKLL